ncbi:N-6 DNA methylase [Tenacibaculum sp. 47A_GOM-205m]|uniref:N-6 DNA methylase n=1 Tax=Tenacibaculum sp. 47A_GOM-205m TaxID=1380384 RepID=UPI00048C025D|nr:N-6 DNA methylase [Tenacibaculum sp. 47A_GOM-205m]
MALKSLLEKLNLSNQEGIFFYNDIYNEKTDFLSVRIKEVFYNQLKPDAFFCINNEPLILFFDKNKERDLKRLEKQIWNLNQSPVVFINNGNEWVIKNGFKFLNEEGEKTLSTLSNNLSDFEYFEIITGKSWEKYQREYDQKNRVDSYLLKNIEDTRAYLTDEKQGNLNDKVANFLIGRVIFVRYLIDRDVELDKYGISKKEDFYDILTDHKNTYSFFKQIKSDFNGNLFPLKYKVDDVDIYEEDQVSINHLSVISKLLKGTEIKTGQSSLFDIYDFSIIPVEFISNVYEKFIGIDNQANNGAYYTPLFLVDYIQKDTVSKYLRENPTKYNCKVLDPACGSGIFLVEAYRKIIAQYIKNNPLNLDNDKEYEQYKEILKTLLTDNIFGIDKDENAISVAVFSLYITLLDHLKPKRIIGFQFPVLEDNNFFVADFFDINHNFNSIFSEKHFQFILGNPPWKSKGHPPEKQMFEEYVENRKNTEKSKLEIVHREIAESFIVRVSDFSFDETAFIVVSKILYKTEKKGVFRNYFLNNFSIRKVVELSSVRHQVFNSNAVAPATILFYKKEQDNEKLRNNVVEHISLKPNVFFGTFKLMVIEKYDIKKIAQKFFIDEDWAWKVFVYGNVLDYYLVKRLKEYNTIGDVISNSDNFVVGQGLKFKDGNRKVDTSNFANFKFIGSLDKRTTNYKNHIEPFYVKQNFSDWDKRQVGYFPDNPLIFESPTLLITGGVTKYFRALCAVLYENALFKSSLTAIKALSKEGVDELKGISAILNSSFFSYYMLSTGSSSGIEREETHDSEKWQIPFTSSREIVDTVSTIEELLKKSNESLLKDNSIEVQIENYKRTLENMIIDLFAFSNQEKSLIDYTNNISIPLLLKGKEGVLKRKKIFRKIIFKESSLEDYAKIFISHFGKRFNSDGNYFEVEILYSNHTILMKFKIISKPSEYDNCIVWKNKDGKKLLKTIAKLHFENLSDNLYLQKDIKGFEEDYFYVAKPNQYKLWHTALAHLDLSEFINALNKSDE